MIDQDTRLDHLMVAAMARWGVAAVLEQVSRHVDFNIRFATSCVRAGAMGASIQLREVMATIRTWEAMEEVEDGRPPDGAKVAVARRTTVNDRLGLAAKVLVANGNAPLTAMELAQASGVAHSRVAIEGLRHAMTSPKRAGRFLRVAEPGRAIRYRLSDAYHDELRAASEGSR